jgi:ComF family protein
MACITCQRTPPAWREARCAVDYGFPWSGLMAEFKFQGQPQHAGLFARLMLAAVDRQAEPPAVDWVVPVPLTPERLRERGYNQAWEIARRVARSLRKPGLPTALLRRGGASNQASLGREARRDNLAGTFRVNPQHATALRGTRVALVDDVMTTGATFEEAARALLAAGASEVSVWAFARTPPPPST